MIRRTISISVDLCLSSRFCQLSPSASSHSLSLYALTPVASLGLFPWARVSGAQHLQRQTFKTYFKNWNHHCMVKRPNSLQWGVCKLPAYIQRVSSDTLHSILCHTLLQGRGILNSLGENNSIIQCYLGFPTLKQNVDYLIQPGKHQTLFPLFLWQCGRG